jgi:hypothetical protein
MKFIAMLIRIKGEFYEKIDVAIFYDGFYSVSSNEAVADYHVIHWRE